MSTTDTSITHGELVATELNADADFRRDWEHHAPARMVAAKLIEYRHDHELSQRDLAELLGVKQPQVARWESGESLPRPESLSLLAGKLQVEFVFSYAPEGRKPKAITHSIAERAGNYTEGGAVVRFAAA